MSALNSTSVRCKWNFEFFKKHLLDTLTARKEFDVLHPATSVIELRKMVLFSCLGSCNHDFR